MCVLICKHSIYYATGKKSLKPVLSLCLLVIKETNQNITFSDGSFWQWQYWFCLFFSIGIDVFGYLQMMDLGFKQEWLKKIFNSETKELSHDTKIQAQEFLSKYNFDEKTMIELNKYFLRHENIRINFDEAISAFFIKSCSLIFFPTYIAMLQIKLGNPYQRPFVFQSAPVQLAVQIITLIPVYYRLHNQAQIYCIELDEYITESMKHLFQSKLVESHKSFAAEIGRLLGTTSILCPSNVWGNHTFFIIAVVVFGEWFLLSRIDVTRLFD
jgi:hypothetical protein